MYPAVAARRRCRVPEFILESFRLGNTSEITAFDGDPGDLMVFGGRLVDFSQSCVKTVALAYTERESWHDPACPDVPVLVFSAWCPDSLTIKWALLVHGTCPGSLCISTAASACRNVPRGLQRSMVLCRWGERGQKRSSIPSPCLTSGSYTWDLGENYSMWLEEKGESLYFPRGLEKYITFTDICQQLSLLFLFL